MRPLADENFPLPTIEALRHAGYDVTWARTDHPGAKDIVLLELAESDGRVLVTLDKDFWQIAFNAASPSNRAA
jgi:predicted nuclease of predicted toxin-antitoxin system